MSRMYLHQNPHRRRGLSSPALRDVPFPPAEAEAPRRLLARLPGHDATPLRDAPGIARRAGVAAVAVKDERARLGLGSFKALGAMHAVALDAERGRAAGRTYVSASLGNHGLALAAAARAFGAAAVVYLPEAAPSRFAAALAAAGARTIRAGARYEDSLHEAGTAARRNGWDLLCDSSWPGYLDRPLEVMEGYLALLDEAADQHAAPPTHIFVQAGTGALAASAAALARARWGEAPCIVVVEPAAAPALHASLAEGRPVRLALPRDGTGAPAAETPGNGPSCMGRLDCRAPSLIALKGLARDADWTCLLTEEEGREAAAVCAAEGLATTPSGAAGLAALLAAGPWRGALGLTPASRALCILTEAAG